MTISREVSIMWVRNTELKKKLVRRFVITARFLEAATRCDGKISELKAKGV